MKNIYYIAIIATMGLTACQGSDEAVNTNVDKTPIAISASVDISGTATTRAADASFASGDMVTVGMRNSASTDYNALYFKKTEFTVSTDKTTLATPVLYWDDFSSTIYDLKEGGGNTLNVLYGVCKNGGTATVTDAGTFSWTVNSDQKTNGTQASDLLLANTLNKVAYSRTADKTVKIPFSHAMSEITINLTASDGYSSTTANFTNTAVTLQSMNTSCDVDAANLTTPLTNSTSANTVTMKNTAIANTTATYQAIVVPGTAIASGNTIAKITDVNNNSYDIVLSDAILGDAATAGTWANNLSEGKLKAGVNYVLNVTLKKQAISVTATVADWIQTTPAEANGVIKFTADGTTQGTTSITEAAFTKAFTPYTSTTTTDANYVKGSNFTNNGTNYSTTTPMYWTGNDDSRYFRTAIYDNSTETAESAPTITNGQVTGIIAETYSDTKDILWGTNGDFKYKATSTEAVKMHFSHALAKVKVTLATSAATDADYVDLSNVDHISITNVKTTGGIMGLHTGDITSSDALSELKISAANTEYLVLPQSIGSTAVLVVTMKDGTTYSTNMNTGLSATSWVRGTSYTYTITIKKSAVTFSAQIKDWITSESSGVANMDWD